MNKATVLIVDDTPENLDVLVSSLSEAHYEVSVATNGEDAIAQLTHLLPDLILLDVMMPGLDGYETCRRIKARPESADIPVIFMTALSEIENKVQAFEAGAVDYVTKPLDHAEVLARVRTHLTLRELQVELESRVAERTRKLQNALEEVDRLKTKLEAENAYLQEEIQDEAAGEIVGRSTALKKALDLVKQVAPTDAAVLITGETGTGKEVLARAIHAQSPRSDRPMIKVNCAALPENLIESELFGHEKGAFTGASGKRAGRFELADNGTLLLDEVGDLPLALQAKLLRVLQEGEFERLGGNETLKVDVRVVAATNRDLEAKVADGSFREDLFYRLNVFPIESPPLRTRKGDLPRLVQHFVKTFAARHRKAVTDVSQDVMPSLEAYDWPGNVRELENVIERAVILSRGDRLEAGEWLPKQEETSNPPNGQPTLEEVERMHVLDVLKATNWRIRGDGGAAETLGLKPTTLEARIKRLGIVRSTESEA